MGDGKIQLQLRLPAGEKYVSQKPTVIIMHNYIANVILFLTMFVFFIIFYLTSFLYAENFYFSVLYQKQIS